MGWNFDENLVRIPRSILRVEVEAETSATEPLIKLVLMRVLGRFPEARDAFVKAIQETFEGKRVPIPNWAT
jgi:hypothetical protein